MATQHPDNAFAPYWDAAGDAFVVTHQEINEAVACFKDLGVSEYMWDWEGKHADAAVIDRLFTDHYDYFSKNQLGRDKFLTFRIPNIWEEKGYNLLQAMTVILSSEDFARDLKFEQRPLFEIILPMTERADQLTHMQQLFTKLARFKSREFTTQHETNTDYIEIIPLVESVESQLAVGDLLAEYVNLHEKHFHHRPEYIRPFLAGSDSALSSGFLAGIIGNKIALSRIYEFSAETAIPVFPIAGTGSLIFRGGLSPHSIDRFLKEFPGLRTATVQSSFRYDHPQKVVKAAIERLEQELPLSKPHVIDASRQKRLMALGQRSASFYQQTLHEISADMQPFFQAVPRRRDRRQHIGLLAYSRSMGTVQLPRAITFTAGFYSAGVPPELIGLGRTLRRLNTSDLAILKSEYTCLTDDIQSLGGYVNLENLQQLASHNQAWSLVLQDITATQEVLGIHMEPSTSAQLAHHKLAEEALRQKNHPSLLTGLIDQMACLRKSLG